MLRKAVDWCVGVLVFLVVFLVLAIVIGNVISFLWRVTGFRDLFDRHPWLNDWAPATFLLIILALAGWQDHEKNKEKAKVRALTDVEAAIATLTAVDEDSVGSARAKTKLHDAIRSANDVGVRLKALPDDVVASLEKLNQLENAIAAEHAASDRRRGIHQTALWGIVALAFAVLLVYLGPNLPFVHH
jgi:hypothetical protein